MRLIGSTARVLALTASLTTAGTAFGTDSADPSRHFDPKGKPPSKFTIELQSGLRRTLPFEDKLDFESQRLPTSRSWVRPVTWPGIWEATSSC
jgi:hypothetical protein